MIEFYFIDVKLVIYFNICKYIQILLELVSSDVYTQESPVLRSNTGLRIRAV